MYGPLWIGLGFEAPALHLITSARISQIQGPSCKGSFQEAARHCTYGGGLPVAAAPAGEHP